MKEINLVSPAQVKKLLQERGLGVHKKWGQNFLVDRNTVDKILREVGAQAGEHILEIGPGLGVITLPMAQGGANLLAVEIDRGLTDLLEELLEDFPQAKLWNADIRKINLRDLIEETWKKQVEVKLVANLPYYITSPLLYRLLEGEVAWTKAVLMMQKEVAQRLVAPAGSPDYGALSVLAHCFTQTQYRFTVSRNVFFPAPQVESAVVTSIPVEAKYGIPDLRLFKQVVFAAFAQRRKTLLNSLHRGLGFEKSRLQEWLEQGGISSKRRGEELTPQEFAKLSILIYNVVK